MKRHTQHTEAQTDRMAHSKHLLSQSDEVRHSLSRDSGIYSVGFDSGQHSQGSVRGSGKYKSSSKASEVSPRSSLRSSLDRTLPRELDFTEDDTMTYASSSSIRDMFRDLESVPVKDKAEDMQGFYDAPSVLSPRSSVRGIHDSMLMSSGVFPDTDSGFSSSFKGKTLQHSDDFLQSPRSQQASPGALVKARSMSRLNSPFVSQEMTPFTSSPFQLDRSLRNLKGNLEDSENRRCVLMHKLKEAQDTLELQSDRLAKIENAAKGNSILVEDLRLKERDYRRKIDTLKLTEQEKDMLKMENIKLRQEMQDRIDKLDFALRSLQAQHQVTENENQKRILLLEHTSQAMSMLETENNRLNQDNSTMKQEMAVAKEAINLARSKFEPMEEENKSLRVETMRLKEENAELSKKLSELTGQLMELRKLTQSMKDENEKLADSWKNLAEDKQKISKQLDSAQEKATDMKLKASTASSEKDRLFQEKIDLNNKFQQLLVNKEQLERTKILLEEQLNDQSTEVMRAKQTTKKRDDEKKKLEEEIHDLKRMQQDLTSDLSSVRAYYERALEQISTLENGKKVQQQQNDWNAQEHERLKSEVDRLSKVAEGKTKELKREKEEMEDSLQSLKGELRGMRSDKSLLENKVEELETKLNKANEDIKYSATTSQEELDTWKDTCDRLTASVSRKESEIQALSDKCLDLEDLTGKLQTENRALKDDCDHLSEQVEDITKLKDQNRKLIQEKAENEQMIKLLETQKEVLTKSSENQLTKLHDVEHLTHKVEQFRNENERLRERVLELEKVRDNLVEQKEDLLASTELIYKKPKLEELEKRIDELREANKQLRDINEDVNEKCDSLEQQLFTESQKAPCSTSHDQTGLKVKPNASGSRSSPTKTKNAQIYLSEVAGQTKQSSSKEPLTHQHDSKLWSAGRHKTNIVTSHLGPILLGEDVVFEKELHPSDRNKILIDPKLGAILVHKQDVPCSDIGHILVGQRVATGKRVKVEGHIIDTKVGPVSLGTNVVFRNDINPDDTDMVVSDPIFGEVLMCKVNTEGHFEGKLIVSTPPFATSGDSSSDTASTFDSSEVGKHFHDRGNFRTAHVYIESVFGPVLIRDGFILESDIGPEEKSDLICDPKFGRILVNRHPVDGTKVSEILVGRRVVSNKALRERSMLVHGKMFLNSDLGPILIGESFILESEFQKSDSDRVIMTQEVGPILVTKLELPGTEFGSIFVGKRITSTDTLPQTSHKITECKFGHILMSGLTVTENDLTPQMLNNIIDIPEVGFVTVQKIKIPNSQVEHIIVGKKIDSISGSKLETCSAVSKRKDLAGVTEKVSVESSHTYPKQTLIHSDLGIVLMLNDSILESELDLETNETVMIHPEIGPIVVAKQHIDDSELHSVLIGKKVVREKESKLRVNAVVDTVRGQMSLSAEVIFESDITSHNKNNVVCDPVHGKIFITPDSNPDLTLQHLPVVKKVVTPLRDFGRNVILDTKYGSVSVVQQVMFESEICPSEHRYIVPDLKYGKIFVSKQKFTDSIKGETLVGYIITCGSRVDESLAQDKKYITDQKFGRVCIENKVVFESDVMLADRDSVFVDPKLGPVLVSDLRVFDHIQGTAVEGKRIVSNGPAFIKFPENTIINHIEFGNILIKEEVVFYSDLEREGQENIIFNQEHGSVLVAKEKVAHPNEGPVYFGRRIISGTKIPEGVKVVVEFPKGSILIGSEMILENDLSEEDMKNMIADCNYGPLLILDKTIVDSGKNLFIAKRVAMSIRSHSVKCQRKIVEDDKFGKVFVGEEFIPDTDIMPGDINKIFVDPIVGPVLVTGDVVNDTDGCPVPLGKRVVSSKVVSDGKKHCIKSKKGPVVIKDDLVFESDLQPSQRHDVILHPDLRTVLVTKCIIQDPEIGYALLGKKILLKSKAYEKVSLKRKFIKVPKLGTVFVSSQAVMESELSPSDKLKLIYDTDYGKILITNEVSKVPERGLVVVGRQVIRCPSRQIIQSEKGYVLITDETVSESELPESEMSNVILDPELGKVLITDQEVQDSDIGTVSIGKRVIRPGKPCDPLVMYSQNGPVLLGTRTILESDLSPSDRELIILDPNLGPILLTKDVVHNAELGSVIVGRRIVTELERRDMSTKMSLNGVKVNYRGQEGNPLNLPTCDISDNISRTADISHDSSPKSIGEGHVIWSSQGNVLVMGDILESEINENEIDKIIWDPEFGAVLTTDQYSKYPKKGHVVIGKKIVVSLNEEVKTKVIKTEKFTVLVVDEYVHESELSPLDRENIILDNELGMVFVSGQSKCDTTHGEVKVGKKVHISPKLQNITKKILHTSQGQILVDDHCILPSQIDPSDAHSIILDPETGPIFITKQTVCDPDFGTAFLGKRVFGLEKQIQRGVDIKDQIFEGKIIKCRQGPVLVKREFINDSELTLTERESMVLDPELGPVFITSKSVHDKNFGPAFIGKRILTRTCSDFKGKKIVQSGKGQVVIGQQEKAESELSSVERENIMVVPDVGLVLKTDEIVENTGNTPVIVGKRIVFTPKQQETAGTNNEQGLIREKSIHETNSCTGKQNIVFKGPLSGPLAVTQSDLLDSTLESVKDERKLVGSSNLSFDMKRIIQSSKGPVVINDGSIRESQLSPMERENVVLIPDIGPVLVTDQRISEANLGSALVGIRIITRRRSSARNKVIKTKQGAILVADDSVLEAQLKMTDWENIVMSPDLGPVLVKQQPGYDPALGTFMTGKRVVLTSKIPSDKMGVIKTKKGTVFVVKDCVYESNLTSKDRENTVFNPNFGLVTLTGSSVTESEIGTMIVGKKIITDENIKKIHQLMTKDGLVTVGKDCIFESELSNADKNRVITDQNLGPILIWDTSSVSGKISYKGKRVVSCAEDKDASLHMSTAEVVVDESEMNSEEKENVFTHPDLGPLVITNVSHPKLGIINVAKRVITKQKESLEVEDSSFTKHMQGIDKKKMDTDIQPGVCSASTSDTVDSQPENKKFYLGKQGVKSLGEVGSHRTEDIPNMPAEFVIESELGPLYVERIFAPGTKHGFILKGTPLSSQGFKFFKNTNKDAVILETEFGNIFVDSAPTLEQDIDYSKFPKVKLVGSINLLTTPKGRQLPLAPATSGHISSSKYHLVSDFSVFEKLKNIKVRMKFVSKAIQTNMIPVISMETQTVLDSDAMTFLTGKFYHEENIELKEAVGGDGSVVPKYDLERIRGEKERIESDMENLRRDYDSLIERHDQYVQDYGPDGEQVLKEKDKVNALNREKEGLEKQVALINGQLLLVESSKKRLDEVVEDLQHEIVHLRKELEEAEKHGKSDFPRPVGGAEIDQLQTEVEELRNELTKSQKEKMKQENLVRSLKEELDDERTKNPTQIRESLDDVGTELHDMRGELHKLVGVIQNKDQAIETLENQLRQSKEKIEDKDKEMLELKIYLKDKNVDTAKSYEDIPKRAGIKASKIPRRSDDGKGTGAAGRSVRKPGESKLLNRLKPTESNLQMKRSNPMNGSDSDLSKTSITPGLYGTKYISSQPQRTHSLTEKGSGDRLQSLISKYRSYGESSGQLPERKIKPLPLTGSNKMGLVTRGRSFGPAAPKGSDGKVSPVEEVEAERDTSPKLPLTPPPIIRVTTPDDERPPAQSSPTLFTQAGPDSHEGKGPTEVAVFQDEGEQSGDDYDFDDNDLDTQEQRDINSLIQNCYRSHLKFLVALRRDRGQSSRKTGGGKKRATHPKPLLSVSPPKLTSKVIGDLLRTHPTSEQTKSHPGSPDSTPANLSQTPGSPNSSPAISDLSKSK